MQPDRKTRPQQQRLPGRAMLSLRTHALITGAIFAALLAIGWGGNLLDAVGLVPHDRGIQIAVLALMLGLCVGLAFSAVPLMVLDCPRLPGADRECRRSADPDIDRASAD